MAELYPPSPAGVPRNLARLSSRYRWQVVLVFASLLFSLVLYLALLAASAWLCHWLVTAPWPFRPSRGYAFVRIAGIVSSGLLCLYLLKGLFKTSVQDWSLLLEIKESDQPQLFDFIRRICAETGAPFPGRVYVTPEVNAAVFYHSSFLNLILPTRKNLLIGLGLVNMLNLSEFKAVVAHEFGHFSQKSMKLGSYVYVANKVLADIIYGRDFLDDLVHRVKHWDLRIAVFAWLFLGVLWGLRKLLEGVFKAINIFNLSLMRQMEFNADRVSVSVAGSDAMVHALVRTSFADQAFRQLASDLWSAADHGLYSRDIFHHLRPAGELLRRRARNPRLGRPPDERGRGVQVFQPGEGDVGIPPMWLTHPSYYDREQSAKEIFVAAEIDERSPWLLFREDADVRFRVSQRYYQVAHRPEQPLTYVAPERVQQFLDEEYAETTFADRYHGFYDNGYLEVADLGLLLREAHGQSLPPATAETLVGELEGVYGPQLKGWVEDNWRRLGELNLLVALQAGQATLRSNSFTFRDQTYGTGDIPALLERVQEELDADRAHKANIDAAVFRTHWRLARHLGCGDESPLAERYRFHLALQNLHQQIVQACQETQGALSYAGSRQELSADEFAQVRDVFIQSLWKLYEVLKNATKLRIPPLKNMPADLPLREFLLQQRVVGDISSDAPTIDPEWMNRFIAQLGEVQDKLKRLLFKSLGGILASQERIVQQSRDYRPTTEPTALAASPPAAQGNGV